MIRKCNMAVVVGALTVVFMAQAMDAAALTAVVATCPPGKICTPITGKGAGGTAPGGTGETGITIITAPVFSAPVVTAPVVTAPVVAAP